MFYREVGDLKTSYRSDQQVLTITQERYAAVSYTHLTLPTTPYV